MAKLKQKRIIIFDFNRTLYDPEADVLLPAARRVLAVLRRRGFSLFLVSRASNSREALIDNLGIRHYFEKIIISSRKSLDDFCSLLVGQPVDDINSFVVGDRVREEINFGNRLGLNTIWLQRGQFAQELPQTVDQEPNHTIKNLREILKIVR